MTQEAEVRRSAVLSDDGLYRYRLDRWWGDGSRVVWVMLNPSTADADVDDPTIRRVMRFSRDWGYNGCTVVNLFALRATNPRELNGYTDAIGGLRNGDEIDNAVTSAPMTVAAWGVHGRLFDAGPIELRRHQREGRVLHHLGLTKDGHPRHPLYVPANTEPIAYRPERLP